MDGGNATEEKREEKIQEEEVVEPEAIVYEEPKVKLERPKPPVTFKFGGVLMKKEKKKYKPPQPIKKVVYEKVEEIFERENPTLRKSTIDKKGNLQINFSKGMVFPPNWYNMRTNDQNRKVNPKARLLQE